MIQEEDEYSEVQNRHNQININLHTTESRTALTKMVMRLFGLWQITIADQAALLNRSLSSIRRYRNGCKFTDDKDVLDRIVKLFSIHKSLCTLCSQNGDIEYRWIVSENQAFDGQAPIVVMKKGLDGMIEVLSYLESSLHSG